MTCPTTRRCEVADATHFADISVDGNVLNSEFCSAQINSSGGRLTLLDAFSVTLVFLEAFFGRSGEDLPLFEVIGPFTSPLDDCGCLNDSSVWVDWIESVGKVRS